MRIRHRTRTLLSLLAVVIVTGVLLSMAGCSWVKGGDTEEEPGWVEIDFPDCEKDDRSPKWESADCGRSPASKGKVTIKVTPKKTTAKPTKTPGQATQR